MVDVWWDGTNARPKSGQHCVFNQNVLTTRQVSIVTAYDDVRQRLHRYGIVVVLNTAVVNPNVFAGRINPIGI